jgi:hypothetical protein
MTAQPRIENFRLAHFQMVLNIVFVPDILTHSLFRCYTQFAKEDVDREP